MLALFKVGLAQLWRSFQKNARFSQKIGAVRANLRHVAMDGKGPAVMLPETAPTLGLRAKKIPTDKSWDFTFWWRRGELNPRPQVLRYKIYMRIRSIVLITGYPIGRENPQPASSFLALYYPTHAYLAIL